MTVINTQINCLEGFPPILKNLISMIPVERFYQKRIRNKWTIYEQLNHLVIAQEILMARFRQFERENHPHIKSYEPQSNSNFPQAEPEINTLLEKLSTKRKGLVKMLRAYDSTYWEKTGSHDVFAPYSSKILLTHTLNVDYAHLISVEQLGLTRNEFEDGIITIP